MAICPTPQCGEKLSVHSRRLYCEKCRSYMGRWARKTPAEIVLFGKRLVRSSYRLDHVKERRMDQAELLVQGPVRRNGKKK